MVSDVSCYGILEQRIQLVVTGSRPDLLFSSARRVKPLEKGGNRLHHPPGTVAKERYRRL